MQGLYKKGQLRSVIRNAKEGILVYRPDLGLATRCGFYSDNSILQGLMLNELLAVNEIAHGLSEGMTADGVIKLYITDQNDIPAEPTQYVYVSDGEVEYAIFRSEGGVVLVEKKKLKTVNLDYSMRYFTNEKKSVLEVRDQENEVKVVLTAFIPKESAIKELNEVDWPCK